MVWEQECDSCRATGSVGVARKVARVKWKRLIIQVEAMKDANGVRARQTVREGTQDAPRARGSAQPFSTLIEEDAVLRMIDRDGKPVGASTGDAQTVCGEALDQECGPDVNDGVGPDWGAIEDRNLAAQLKRYRQLRNKAKAVDDEGKRGWRSRRQQSCAFGATLTRLRLLSSALPSGEFGLGNG